MFLYPNLREQTKSEGGSCPICLSDITAHGTTRFACTNSHLICHRCRPYFYSCPSCLQPLKEISDQNFDSDEQILPVSSLPYPMHFSHPYPPTAPKLQEFLTHEQEIPSEEQKLLKCPNSYLGCTAKFAPSINHNHISNCQYRRHSLNTLPTQPCDDSELIACRYNYLGCKVQVPVLRLQNHENICIYKNSRNSEFEVDKYNRREYNVENVQPSEIQQLLECPNSHLGCTAKFVPSLSQMHISRCLYRNQNSGAFVTHSYGDSKPMTCKYQYRGCNVRVPVGRLQTHENVCIYKDVNTEYAEDHHNQLGYESACQRPQFLEGSAYSQLGCTSNIESALNEIHISGNDCSTINAAQFHDDSMLTMCRYHYLGCNVRVPVRRLQNHEDICIYKDSIQSPKFSEGQPHQGERLPCRYCSQGCNVRTMSYRLRNHEEICIYKNRI